MATENQMIVLNAIRTNDFGAFNGGKVPASYVFNASDWDVWANCLDCCAGEYRAKMPKGRALGAVVSTLVQAGLVICHGSGRDACVRFTKAGFDLVRGE